MHHTNYSLCASLDPGNEEPELEVRAEHIPAKHYRKQTNVHRPKYEEHMFMTEEHNLCSSANRGT
jgi:hypothetical protein